MAFFRAILIGAMCAICALPVYGDERIVRQRENSGATTTRPADSVWKGSGKSFVSSCSGQTDGTRCKIYGAEEATCRNQHCRATKCDSNTYLVVVAKGDGTYRSDYYCTSRTASCKSNEKLRTVRFNGAEAAVKENGKFWCVSFDDICTEDVKKAGFMVEGTPIVGASHDNDYCRPEKCVSGYVLNNKGMPTAKCVPCQGCQEQHATCEPTGSDGMSECYYETACEDGYGDIKNDRKYNPICTANTYSIEYNGLDGATCSDAPTTYTYNVATTVNCMPTKSGYTFEGWTLNGVDIGMPHIIGPGTKGDIKFVVKGWIPIQQAECSNEDIQKLKAAGAATVEFKKGKCVITSCENPTAYISENKDRCVECPKCNNTTVTCEISVELNKCKYKTKCNNTNYNLHDENTVNAYCTAPGTHKISFRDIDESPLAGCDDTIYTEKESIVVNCDPVKPGFRVKKWMLNGRPLDSGLPYTINENDTDDKKFTVAEWERVDCSDVNLSTYPHATNIEFVDGNCKVKGCENDYEVDENNNRCVEREKKRTECTEDELANLNAVAGNYINDRCVPTKCIDGYILQNGNCVENTAQKEYDDAKARETSFENRMLGGTTMLATGVGGMNTGIGIARKMADDAADKAMADYLSTFKCYIGNDEHEGGEKNIAVPGLNQLNQLKQEYNRVASSLKIRKEQLGMTPGIESEVVLDKSNMGLYDDKSTGSSYNGIASRYRAAMGSQQDADALAKKSEDSKNQLTAGAATTGAGVVGGVAGNLMINYSDGEDSIGAKLKSIISQ